MEAITTLRRNYPTTGNISTAVKLFMNSKPEEVEAAVNMWLREHHVKVHHIAQSQSEKSGKFVFVITLHYSEEAY